MVGDRLTVERLTGCSDADAVGIGRLMRFLHEDFDGSSADLGLLNEIIASPYHDQIVARLGEQVVGTAIVSIILGAGTTRVDYLEDFVTDIEVRGQGAGRLIWQEIMKWCTENGG